MSGKTLHLGSNKFSPYRPSQAARMNPALPTSNAKRRPRTRNSKRN